ncbi:hypothetical protein [Gordonia sp. (in: high G+C Gram-positive bacteria)]|uniref:hypothetical protein n=1 Tax=Gordonia sp. (in: high G+C Gram-positive bacteria) TaxID=84139 RepID=UPI003C70B747
MKRAGLCAAVAGVSLAMVASLLPGGEAAAGPAVSAPPTSVTVFGDSFSDVGTYAPATGDPANPGRFTVNPGNVWVQDVAAAYGLTVARIGRSPWTPRPPASHRPGRERPG